MLEWVLHRTSFKDWDYERATALWYRWHKHVCHRLHWSRDKHKGLTFSTGIKHLVWVLQCRWVCAPLDDWSHSRKEVEVPRG